MVGSRSHPRRFGDCNRSLCFAWQTNSSRTTSAFPKRSTRTETCDGTASAGLFARRGFNIESLAFNITDDPKTSRMTIVVGGDDDTIEQITKQLNKLVDVIKVHDHTGESVVERELALIKVNSEMEQRTPIIQLVEIFRASIVDVGADTMTIEITGDSEKIDALVELLRPFGIRELVRTGKIILERGSKSL
jgi:acetolactate synthase-1/3 small subunit